MKSILEIIFFLKSNPLWILEISLIGLLFLLFVLYGKKKKSASLSQSSDVTPISLRPSLRGCEAAAATQKPLLNEISSQDIKAIAGDDVMTTQLDLARAYIEMGKKKLAEKILNHVAKHGESHHRQAAQQLISTL